jgi:hypothetical protein
MSSAMAHPPRVAFGAVALGAVLLAVDLVWGLPGFWVDAYAFGLSASVLLDVASSREPGDDA